MTLLDQIRNPADLRALPKEQVPAFGEAVDACLVRHGGRIGAESIEAERGVVDLVVALHRVFDFQRDRLVLDASHPALAHKVITGRRRRLASLDRADGLSRHMHRGESPYDVLTTGHAGTAISLAAGMARADAIRGVGGRRIVALLDQQATGTGIALEALNEIGGTDTNLLVVVHDAEFAFQRTTGSLRRYLNRMRTLPGYREGKKELLDALGGLPFVGGGLSRWAGNVKEAVANYLSPGHLFREFGWTYFGPENGHDVLKLEQLLLDLQRVEGPVLLHVVTDRQRAAEPQALDAGGAIAPPPVDVDVAVEAETTEPDAPAASFEDALGAGLTRAMRHDPRVVAILPTALQGARRGSHAANCGLERLAREQEDRVFLTGPAPEHALAMAAGMAELGMRPVCVLRAADVARAHDQLWQEITLQSLPVVVVLQGAGLVDAEGPADARSSEVSWLRTLPGLTVLGPADERETVSLLRHALASPGPSVMRLPQRPAVALPGTDAPVRQGRPVRLHRGSEIVLVADGTTAAATHAAAVLLASGEDGGGDALACRVLHARFLQPLEPAVWQQALRGAQLAFVVEEHVEAGSLGQALRAMHATTSLGETLQLRQHGVPARLLQGGDAATWRRRFGLDAEGIAARVRQEWRALEVDPAHAPMSPATAEQDGDVVEGSIDPS